MEVISEFTDIRFTISKGNHKGRIMSDNICRLSQVEIRGVHQVKQFDIADL